MCLAVLYQSVCNQSRLNLRGMYYVPGSILDSVVTFCVRLDFPSSKNSCEINIQRTRSKSKELIYISVT